MVTFAETLRELRERAGLTQAALAERSALSIGSVRNYEQGLREPYWAAVFRLAKALGVSPEEFAPAAEAHNKPAPKKTGPKKATTRKGGQR
jgi:transcriptional regulator with XRE-family HTH domain